MNRYLKEALYNLVDPIHVVRSGMGALQTGQDIVNDPAQAGRSAVRGALSGATFGFAPDILNKLDPSRDYSAMYAHDAQAAPGATDTGSQLGGLALGEGLGKFANLGKSVGAEIDAIPRTQQFREPGFEVHPAPEPDTTFARNDPEMDIHEAASQMPVPSGGKTFQPPPSMPSPGAVRQNFGRPRITAQEPDATRVSATARGPIEDLIRSHLERRGIADRLLEEKLGQRPPTAVLPK